MEQALMEKGDAAKFRKLPIFNNDPTKKLSEKEEKNLILKKFNEKEFIKDLASCKALIANGGFCTITEAVQLGKPVLSVPIKKQFEQILNAIFVDKLGYGEFHRKLKVDKIKDFISNIDIYKENLINRMDQHFLNVIFV